MRIFRCQSFTLLFFLKGETTWFFWGIEILIWSDVWRMPLSYPPWNTWAKSTWKDATILKGKSSSNHSMILPTYPGKIPQTFPKPHKERKSFINCWWNIRGYLPGVCGWDLRIIPCKACCVYAVCRMTRIPGPQPETSDLNLKRSANLRFFELKIPWILQVKFNYTIWKVDGATPKRWLSKGLW